MWAVVWIHVCYLIFFCHIVLGVISYVGGCMDSYLLSSFLLLGTRYARYLPRYDVWPSFFLIALGPGRGEGVAEVVKYI